MNIIKSDLADKKLLENLMQLYLHDMSAYTGDLVNEYGLYELGPYFHLYWQESDRYPYLLIDKQAAVGFALVRRTSDNNYLLGEFFIIRSLRKQGIGAQFAREIFKRHSGRWCVAEIETNLLAQKFWRRVISLFTKNRYKEEWSIAQPAGPMQIFESFG